MGPKFSIRYKFLAATTFLLVVCVGIYLSVATFEFKKDKENLVFDYSRGQVRSLSSDLDSFFKSLKDQLRVAAYFHREKGHAKDMLLEDFLGGSSDLVFVAASERFEKIDAVYYENKDYAKTYGLDNVFWRETLPQSAPVPFKTIQLEGEAIWRAQIPDGPPVIGIGRSVVEVDEKGVPRAQYAVISYVKADRILAAMNSGELNNVWLTDVNGQILVDRGDGLQLPKELFEKAKSSPVKTSVSPYESNGEKFFGAFARAAGGKIFVMSSVSAEKAFTVVNRLVFRSILIASILVTLAFILAILFSRSLTHPLDILMGGMRKVSEGNLETNIHVRSNDEIAILAQSFNRMISDLRRSRAELEEINRDLEKKVLERTRQLDERNQAVKEAQEALLRSTRLAAVGEVAGIAAHEVLNPLQSIISRLTELKRRVQEDRAREAQILLDIKTAWQKDYQEGGFDKLIASWKAPSQVRPGESLWNEDLANIEVVSQNIANEFNSLLQDSEFLIKESHRIGRIVNSFRSMSSVKSEIRSFKVADLVNHSVKIMADLAAKHSIKIDVSPLADDRVLVGEDEFIQVLTNLLRNSIHALQGQPTGVIQIRTETAGNEVRIYVRDNGSGIAPEVQKKIFEKPFTTKSRSEGTGFGLSLSRRLMRAVKGDLSLSWSEVGKGSEFLVKLQRDIAVESRSA